MLEHQRLQHVQPEHRWHGGPLIHAIAVLAVWTWRWNADREGQRPLLGRVTSHAALLLIAVILVILGGVRVGGSISVASSVIAQPPALASAAETTIATTNNVMRAYSRAASQTLVLRQATHHTAIPERPRLDIITYQVQPGETTESIATLFGLQPTTIMWSNPDLEKAPDLLKVGQNLTILPLDGVYHTVVEGDTLESIAEKYKVSVAEISECSFNALSLGPQLRPGSKLIVPGGTKPYEVRKVTTYTGPAPTDASSDGSFMWPAGGYISQGYWYGHRAIDIANAVGVAIVASDGGYVSFSGWTDVGYGYLVVVDHGNGYQTYYAHLSNIFVTEGQVVGAGEIIGAMGSTGNSTGPHLHFEIRYQGYPTNPLIFLP
ncbi:MAG: Murein hydrolase activator NlpD precursor [Chloroflexi bacterium ADurb.Bin360]|nr:MAG: Murein hydrolase activator NlpD precursor [Chloroflexi bacterium ADurb.Bin360]